MSPDDFTAGTIDDHSMVGPYVVNAVTDDERAAFEAHLAECHRCTVEVAELSEPMAGLAYEMAASPPPALRASILDAIKGVEQEPARPRRAAPAEPEPAAPPRLTAVPTAPQVAPDETGSSPATDDWAWRVEHNPQDELALRRSRRLTRGLGVAVAAVAVLALALGGWIANINSQRQQQVAGEQLAQAEQLRYTDLLAAPDVKVYTQNKDGARYSFVVSKSRNEALFLGTALPDPGVGNKYQLWTVQSAPLVDNSVTGSGSVRQWFRGPVDNSAGLAVNIEPAAGPPAATQPSRAILSSVEI